MSYVIFVYICIHIGSINVEYTCIYACVCVKFKDLYMHIYAYIYMYMCIRTNMHIYSSICMCS